MSVALKICGLTNREDAEAAEKHADYLGFVLVPTSSRRIDFDTLYDFSSELFSLRVAVVVNPYAALVRRLLDEHIVDIVQLHGNESPEFARLFDRRRIWKAVHLTDREQLASFEAYPADRIVLDAAHGGSGTVCDWELAREAAALRPCLLAGGLHPGNVTAACRTVMPWGIDLAGGVEAAPGVKDYQKMQLLSEQLESMEDL